MDEFSPGPASFAASERVGDTLKAAREKAGLTLAEVASRTRVPLRHLQSLENNDYSSLPSPTYANGFAKAYARAVNLDEVSVGRQVRGELAGVARTPAYVPVEATDPDRVPSRGLTIVALGVAIALIVIAALYYGTTLLRADGTGAPPPVVAEGGTAATDPTGAPMATATPTAVAPADGQVVVTATQEVWVRIYDADDKTLHQGTLQPGESFDVAADANNPMINVGRPDHIRFTINGSAVTGLDLGRDPVKDVRVSAAALASRLAGTSADQPAATEAAPGRDDRSSSRPSEPRSSEPRPSERRRETSSRRPDRPSRATASVLSDTQRANLEAARAATATGNTQ